MNNGCICCTVRGDLIKVLNKILKLKGKKRLDAVFIETTGMADPAPVAQTFFVDDSVRSKARLDAILTVVDAKHILQHLHEKKAEGAENESVEQVAFADVLLVNKVDLVAKSELETVEQGIREINAFAKIIKCSKGVVPLDQEIGRAVQQECRDRSRMPSSA
eukprot:TRINITY_DN9694_c0_g2_i14.p1 TRINITY_DN9694_c0_g2~~TRINITY_DN9694_c0_g2_i14.p1  ORF type:complete len:162 (-),score=31.30 TRINITY_DN9694_c0_g2_i14:20-505(-)